MSALKDGVFFYFCELISVGERRPWAVHQKDSKLQREATDKRIKRYIQEELERCGVGEGKKGGGEISRGLPNNCTDALNMRPRFSISVKRCRRKKRGDGWRHNKREVIRTKRKGEGGKHGEADLFRTEWQRCWGVKLSNWLWLCFNCVSRMLLLWQTRYHICKYYPNNTCSNYRQYMHTPPCMWSCN